MSSRPQLNIGYERGIITQTLFSIMVMMALVTTFMATPLFELVHGRHGRLLGTVGPGAGRIGGAARLR